RLPRTSVVPHLTSALKARSTILNMAWVKVWSYLPSRIHQRLRQPVLAREIRLRPVVALREVGPAGKSGVPRSSNSLGTLNARYGCIRQFPWGEFGRDSVSAMTTLEPFLKDESHTVRVYSANAVWEISHKPEPVLPGGACQTRSRGPQ